MPASKLINSAEPLPSVKTTSLVSLPTVTVTPLATSVGSSISTTKGSPYVTESAETTMEGLGLTLTVKETLTLLKLESPSCATVKL